MSGPARRSRPDWRLLRLELPASDSPAAPGANRHAPIHWQNRTLVLVTAALLLGLGATVAQNAGVGADLLQVLVPCLAVPVWIAAERICFPTRVRLRGVFLHDPGDREAKLPQPQRWMGTATGSGSAVSRQPRAWGP